MTRRRTASLAALLAALVALAGVQAGTVLADPGDSAPKILEWKTMVGVPSTMLLTAGSIRGFPGPGAAWTATDAKGTLTTDGRLTIKVDGLVLTNTGNNPSAFFRARVSCLDSTNTEVVVTTGQFPATVGLVNEGGGDARIETSVTLPQPCIAPIVFVTNAAGTSWFAVIGG